MPEIRHRIGIEASAADVYAALATPDGVSRWWTREVTGDASVGGTLSFYFAGPQPALAAQVAAATSGERVAWQVVQGPEDWVGTTIEFALTDTGTRPCCCSPIPAGATQARSCLTAAPSGATSCSA